MEEREDNKEDLGIAECVPPIRGNASPKVLFTSLSQGLLKGSHQLTVSACVQLGPRVQFF